MVSLCTTFCFVVVSHLQLPLPRGPHRGSRAGGGGKGKGRRQSQTLVSVRRVPPLVTLKISSLNHVATEMVRLPGGRPSRPISLRRRYPWKHIIRRVGWVFKGGQRTRRRGTGGGPHTETWVTLVGERCPRLVYNGSSILDLLGSFSLRNYRGTDRCRKRNVRKSSTAVVGT